MNKVFNNFVVFTFLLSQLSYLQPSFATAKKEELNLPDYKLSDIFISKDDFQKMKDEDKTLYMISIIFLAQILEISQNRVIELSDKVSLIQSPLDKDTSVKTADTRSSLLNSRISMFRELIAEHKAQAQIGVIRFLIQAGPKIRTAFSSLGKNGKVLLDDIKIKAAAKAEIQAAQNSNAALAREIAKNTKAGISRSQIIREKNVIQKQQDKKIAQRIERDSLRNSEKIAKNNRSTLTSEITQQEKDLASLEKKLAKEKNPSKKNYLQKKIGNAETKLSRAKEDFIKNGGNDVELAKIKVNANKGLGAKALSTAGTVVTVAGTATLAKDGYDYLIEDESGIAKSVKQQLGIEKDVIEPTATYVDTNTDTTDNTELNNPSQIHENVGCIYGLYASEFHGTGEAAKCMRPRESIDASSCDPKTYFKCNSFGLDNNEQPLGKELCVKLYDGIGGLKTLSARCSNKLIDIYKKHLGTLYVDQEKFQEYEDKIKQIVSDIENQPILKSDDGKSRTLKNYCDNKIDLQKVECNAFNALVENFSINHKATIQANLVANSPSNIPKKVFDPSPKAEAGK